MLFDTLDRLTTWAKREIGFVRLSGHAIVEMMDSQTHWVLNAGTPSMKEFVPEEIEWLKQYVGAAKEQEMVVPAGTTILVGAPAKVPDGLLDSLSKALVRNKEVRQAYMGQVHYVQEGERPHLALAFETDSVGESVMAAIRQDLMLASRGFLGKGGCIDIYTDVRDGVGRDIAKAVKPFYTRRRR